MHFMINDETRAKAVRAGARPGDKINAVVCGALTYSRDNDYGFILFTDYSLKIVSIDPFNTYKIKDTFEMPYSGISNIRFGDILYAKLIKFRFNDYKYTLSLYKNQRNISNQDENIEVVLRFFANLKNMQQAS